MDETTRRKLRAFYGSRKWHYARLRVLNRADWICARCGLQADSVHHKPPIRGGNPDDWVNPDKHELVPICSPCHRKEHEDAHTNPRMRWLADLREQFTNQPKESL